MLFWSVVPIATEYKQAAGRTGLIRTVKSGHCEGLLGLFDDLRGMEGGTVFADV